jgi:hypothetical protein
MGAGGWAAVRGRTRELLGRECPDDQQCPKATSIRICTSTVDGSFVEIGRLCTRALYSALAPEEGAAGLMASDMSEKPL